MTLTRALIFLVFPLTFALAVGCKRVETAPTAPSANGTGADAHDEAHTESDVAPTLDDAHQVPSEGAVPSNPPADAEGTEVQDPARNGDVAPASGSRVHPLPFDERRFRAEQPPGRLLGGFAFGDSAGNNYVVFTRQDRTKDEHVYHSTLHIRHIADKDGVVSVVRTYVERIADCDFDVILEPMFGDWSISDLNGNGIGEASFAYTADCVSDVSPRKHKVFVTEGGEKYVLRGHTELREPSSRPLGGDYTADSMPPIFLDKAKDVWNRTAR